MTGRCSTCRLWERRAARPHDDAMIAAGGYCQSPKFTEYEQPSSYARDAVVYPYNEGAGVGSFWTGPDFGCVHRDPQ